MTERYQITLKTKNNGTIVATCSSTASAVINILSTFPIQPYHVLEAYVHEQVSGRRYRLSPGYIGAIQQEEAAGACPPC